MMHTYADEVTHKRIGEKVAALPAMNKAELVVVWAEMFATPPPPKLRKQLMVPILAYRIQERAFGGLSNTTRKRLQVMIEANRAKQSGPKSRALPPVSHAKLIRSWKGEIHEVLVLDEGYLYRGEAFRTLSPIAKRITGTPWSGPAFFGTKPKEAAK